MGTHGRGGFERLVLGSVTEKVLRRANCLVLTVPPPAAARSTLPFKRLLCPVDFSEPSISALEYALSIAQESDGRLTVLHVFDWPTHDELSLEGVLDVPAFRRQREDEARHRLATLIPEDARNWCAPEPTLRHGKPYREILAVAETEHIDLVVMGVHGRNALDVMLFGSNTNQVVRRASCPVLTLKK
jgi:nucleotide-binding universal stress UspA family protein